MPTGFLVLFASAICNYALSSSVSLPCEYSQYNNQLFRCDKIYLEIPTNFDAENIPHNATELELSIPREAPRSCGFTSFCNVLKANAQPFPARPLLRTIRFYGFEGEGGVRFSVNTLLQNAKQYLTTLGIYWSRIGSLDAEYFQGFSALEGLHLSSNGIAEIAPNTFQSLSTGTPVLSWLSLSNNRIETFDWAVLQPLADSLKTIWLSAQTPGMHTIYRSSPKFSLKNVSSLELNNNKLGSIPKEVFETLDTFPHGYNNFYFHSNAFCPTDIRCTCCGFKELQNWMGYVNQSATDGQEFNFVLECGVGTAFTGWWKYEPKITKTQGKWRVQETRAFPEYDINDMASHPNKAIC